MLPQKLANVFCARASVFGTGPSSFVNFGDELGRRHFCPQKDAMSVERRGPGICEPPRARCATWFLIATQGFARVGAGHAQGAGTCPPERSRQAACRHAPRIAGFFRIHACRAAKIHLQQQGHIHACRTRLRALACKTGKQPRTFPHSGYFVPQALCFHAGHHPSSRESHKHTRSVGQCEANVFLQDGRLSSARLSPTYDRSVRPG